MIGTSLLYLCGYHRSSIHHVCALIAMVSFGFSLMDALPKNLGGRNPQRTSQTQETTAEGTFEVNGEKVR